MPTAFAQPSNSLDRVGCNGPVAPPGEFAKEHPHAKTPGVCTLCIPLLFSGGLIIET